MNLTKTEVKILNFLRNVGRARFTDIKKAVGIPDKTVYEVLPKLMEKGLVVKENKLYCKTDKVEDALQSSAVRTYMWEEDARKAIDITHFITKRRARLEEVAVFEAKSATERLKLGFPRILLGARLGSKIGKLRPEQKTLVDELLNVFEEGTRVAVYPSLESSEEAKKIAGAQLQLVGKFLKEKHFRKKVAKKRKLTIMFTMDLSNCKLDEKTLDSAIYLMFV